MKTSLTFMSVVLILVLFGCDQKEVHYIPQPKPPVVKNRNIIIALLDNDSINPEIPRARIIKAISSIQSTKLFNDFLDFEVKSISDMNRYLNDPEFAPIWKKIFTPIDGYSPDATFKGVQDYFGYLENDVDFKKLDEMNDADGTAFVISEELLPKEIGPIWLDFFYAKKLGYVVPSTTSTKNIEVRKVDNGRIEVKEKGPSGEDLNSKTYNNDGSIEGIKTDGDTTKRM